MDNETLQSFRELDRDCGLLEDALGSMGASEKTLYLPTAENNEKTRLRLENLRSRQSALPENDPVLAIYKKQMEYFLDSCANKLSLLDNNPAESFSGLMYQTEFLQMDDCRPDEERMEILKSVYAQAQTLLEVTVKNARLDDKKKSAARGAFSQILRAGETEKSRQRLYFPKAPEAAFKEYMEALEGWYAVLREGEKATAAEAAGTAPAADDNYTVQLEESYYRDQLLVRHGIELDELLSWHKEEVEKTKEEVLAIAAKLPVSDPAPKNVKEANALLLKYAGPCETAAEMMERGRAYLKRTQAAARADVKLPEEDCVLDTVNTTLKDSYPWGGYRGGDMKRKPFRGLFFLNQYNYRNVTDGWIKMNTIHEAYPGHHVQYAHAAADPQPEILKRHARNVPLLEGTAHRSERVYEGIFAEDPFFPLFVAYRRHHTAVRIQADLYLRYYGKTVADTVKLYEDTMGFDYTTARGQVRAHENGVGYFTAYYYGLKKLTDWEQKYGFGENEFTNLLFMPGYLSLDTFEAFLRLSSEDKIRFATGAPSLLRQ